MRMNLRVWKGKKKKRNFDHEMIICTRLLNVKRIRRVEFSVSNESIVSQGSYRKQPKTKKKTASVVKSHTGLYVHMIDRRDAGKSVCVCMTKFPNGSQFLHMNS